MFFLLVARATRISWKTILGATLKELHARNIPASFIKLCPKV